MVRQKRVQTTLGLFFRFLTDYPFVSLFHLFVCCSFTLIVVPLSPFHLFSSFLFFFTPLLLHSRHPPLHPTTLLFLHTQDKYYFLMAQRLFLGSPLKSVATTSAFRTSGRVAGHPGRANLLHLSRPFATSAGTGDYLTRKHSDQKALVHGEPSGPKILTGTIPGPKTKAGLQNLDSLQDTRAATMMTGNKQRIFLSGIHK